MARIRYIKPEFFDDPVLAGCSQGARLLFIALWQVADRSGVFDPDVRKLKKYAFGYDSCTVADVEKMLTELRDIGAICLGLVDGRIYGLVRNLKKHQKFHRDESARLEHIASTLVALCSQGAGTLVAARVTGNGERVTGNGQLVTETETTTNIPAKVKKPRRKKLPGAAPTGVTVPIREAWIAEYKKKYGSDAAWGRRENGQAAQLLGTYPASELLLLIPYFFAWKRSEVIKGGHSFGKGSACFVLKVDELRADIADADRRKLAAQIQEREKLSDTIAVDNDGVNRINALLAQRDEDERRLRYETQSILEQATPGHTNALGQGNPQTLQHAQSEAERRGGFGILHASSTVCERQADLGRASGGAQR